MTTINYPRNNYEHIIYGCKYYNSTFYIDLDRGSPVLAFQTNHKKASFTFSDTVLLNCLGTKWKAVGAIILFVALVLIIPKSKSAKGILRINGLEDSMDGTYCFYAKAIDVSSGISYTVPSQVSLEFQPADDPEFDYPHYDYRIDRIFFDNNTYSEFTNSDWFSPYSKTELLTDNQGKEWECTLINKRAYNEKVVESKGYTLKGILELLLYIVAVIYNIIGCLACKDTKPPADKVNLSF